MGDIVEEVSSSHGQHKAQLVRQPDGLFRVQLFHWVEEHTPAFSRVASFWAPVSSALSSSLDAARAAAQDLLRRHAA